MTPRSQEYLQQARERLSDAQTMLELVHPAATVNTAYYSMLNAARAALSERGEHAKTHSGTWTCSASSSSPAAISIPTSTRSPAALRRPAKKVITKQSRLPPRKQTSSSKVPPTSWPPSKPSCLRPTTQQTTNRTPQTSQLEAAVAAADFPLAPAMQTPTAPRSRPPIRTATGFDQSRAGKNPAAPAIPREPPSSPCPRTSRQGGSAGEGCDSPTAAPGRVIGWGVGPPERQGPGGARPRCRISPRPRCA